MAKKIKCQNVFHFILYKRYIAVSQSDIKPSFKHMFILSYNETAYKVDQL